MSPCSSNIITAENVASIPCKCLNRDGAPSRQGVLTVHTLCYKTSRTAFLLLPAHIWTLRRATDARFNATGVLLVSCGEWSIPHCTWLLVVCEESPYDQRSTQIATDSTNEASVAGRYRHPWSLAQDEIWQLFYQDSDEHISEAHKSIAENENNNNHSCNHVYQ